MPSSVLTMYVSGGNHRVCTSSIIAGSSGSQCISLQVLSWTHAVCYIQMGQLLFTNSYSIFYFTCFCFMKCLSCQASCGCYGLKIIKRFFFISTFLNFFFLCLQESPDFETRKNLVLALLDKHGPAITKGILHACVFYLPSYMMPDLSEVLYELMKVNREVS